MNSQPPLPIQAQLLRILSDLPASQQQEVLDFALFLHQRELTQMQARTPAETLTLKAEFAEEDQAMAEMILPDTAAGLKNED